MMGETKSRQQWKTKLFNVSISRQVKCSLSLTCLLEVLNADIVHWEESCCGSILRTHVGNGGSISDG